MSQSYDVAVIGGGVIGVASACALAERGARVVLLERGELCSGASYGNAGWISPSHGTPLPAPGVIRQALRWLVDPQRRVLALAERAAARGARLETRQEVLALERTGRRVTRIVATRGDFQAAEVVLAAGAWSPPVAALVDLRLPVQAAKGYSVTVRCP